MYDKYLPVFTIMIVALAAVVIGIAFVAPFPSYLQNYPIPPPPAPSPPTFVPYHVDQMKDSPLSAKYGSSGASVFVMHPEIVAALKKIDPGFDSAHIAEASKMSVAEFADDREMLIISGCDKAGCAHGGYAAGYVTKLPKGKAPAASIAFLIETNNPVHLAGISYGSPDESYTRVLTEELGRITASTRN